MGSCLGSSGWFRVPLTFQRLLLLKVVWKARTTRRARPFLHLQNFDDDAVDVRSDFAVIVVVAAAAGLEH